MSAIVSGEILLKYSVVTGAAGNSTAGSAAGSLGKYISTTAWAGGSANDLFDDISGAENAASTADYRGIFVHNNNANNAWQNPVVYLSAEVAGGASVAVAADSVAASALANASAQGLQIASETTAPAGPLTFSSPTTAAGGVSLGASLPVANVKQLWVRRTAANTAALSGDGVTIAVSGDTGSL
jgi:hypothetical protein